ncbi:hypothetical protein [Microbispora triticiradicis]|uniref:hypothetical protein n=1 Tax=Microbispora triticiradicis TaxID=2200763 RepID=UPI001AD76B6C|nr:hypothetical protein [Microbispora triticiradicis]MBO4273630.1 hypothetical protein [Microbispora triticiradicis]
MAEQSMGGVGEEGFGVFYTPPGGRQVELRAARGAFGDDVCRSTPINGRRRAGQRGRAGGG